MTHSRVALSLLLLINTGCAMSTEPKPKFEAPKLNPQTMSFSYRGLNAQNTLGTSDGEHYALDLPSTATLTGWSANRPRGAHTAIGAGVYEGVLDSEGLALLNKMRNLLCRDIKWPPMRSPEFYFNYYLECGGKVYHDAADMGAGLPDGTGELLPTYGALMDHFYANATRTPIKLDVDYEVTLHKNRFLITLRFINNGEQTLELVSPAKWDGVFPRPPLPFGTAASLFGNLNFLLGGEQMLNAKDYPKDEMVIPAGQSREARFIALPTGKGTRGDGPSGGIVAMNAIAPKELGSTIDFRVIQRIRSMPRDYPATPEEWEVWEAQYRKEAMFRVGAAPEGVIPEDGYYRAYVGVGAAKYVMGRFVTRLNKGDIAPPMTGQVDDQGRALPLHGNELKYWQWEADVSSVVEARSGAICPKSGLWTPVVDGGSNNAAHINGLPTRIIVRHGARMPRVGFEDPMQEARVLWRWVGP